MIAFIHMQPFLNQHKLLTQLLINHFFTLKTPLDIHQLKYDASKTYTTTISLTKCPSTYLLQTWRVHAYLECLPSLKGLLENPENPLVDLECLVGPKGPA